jgi:hypothetical protein
MTAVLDNIEIANAVEWDEVPDKASSGGDPLEEKV